MKMNKTFQKLTWLIGVLVYIVLFFKDAQAHEWVLVVVWTGMTCVCAEQFSKLRWKNIQILTRVNDVETVEKFWTHRGARKVFDAQTEALIEHYRKQGLPIHDHRIKDDK